MGSGVHPCSQRLPYFGTRNPLPRENGHLLALLGVKLRNARPANSLPRGWLFQRPGSARSGLAQAQRDPRALRRDDFLGTFAPFFLASLKPMAMACFRLVTRRPDPLLSVPRLRRRMADSTRFCADLPYLAIVPLGVFNAGENARPGLRWSALVAGRTILAGQQPEWAARYQSTITLNGTPSIHATKYRIGQPSALSGRQEERHRPSRHA